VFFCYFASSNSSGGNDNNFSTTATIFTAVDVVAQWYRLIIFKLELNFGVSYDLFQRSQIRIQQKPSLKKIFLK